MQLYNQAPKCIESIQSGLIYNTMYTYPPVEGSLPVRGYGFGVACARMAGGKFVMAPHWVGGCCSCHREPLLLLLVLVLVAGARRADCEELGVRVGEWC